MTRTNPDGVTQEEYWFLQSVQINNRHKSLYWTRHGAVSFLEWAHGFPEAVAFVLAPGPSLAALSEEHAKEMVRKRWMSVGVNRVCKEGPVYADKRGTVPSMAYLQDDIRDVVADGFGILREAGGKVMSSLRAQGMQQDWTVPVYGSALHEDLEFGLTCTGQVGCWFCRSVVSMIHLLALAGYRRVVLLGVDHGEMYGNQRIDKTKDRAIYEVTGPKQYCQEGARDFVRENIDLLPVEMRDNYPKMNNQPEREQASYVYGVLGEWMRKRGQTLWQAGEHAAWDSEFVPKIKLAKAIKGVF